MISRRIDRMLKEVRISSNGKLALLTIAAAAAAILVALTSMTSKDLTAGEKAANAPAVSEDFVYFPSQYVNKATGPSDAIQGF